MAFLRVARGHAQTFITSFAGMGAFALSAVTGPLLAHTLGPSGRGELAAVTVPAELFGFMLAMGWPVAALYFVDRFPRRQLVNTTWAWGLGIGGTAVLCLWWFVPGYLHGHTHSTIPWLRITLVIMVTFVPVQTSIDLLRNKSSLNQYNLLRNGNLILNFFTLIVLALGGWLNLDTALAANAFTQLGWHLIVVAWCRDWPGLRFRFEVFTSQLSYSSRMMFSELSTLVVARLDQVLLVGLVSSRDLGLYAVAAIAAAVTSAGAKGVGFAIFPRILNAKDEGESWEITKQALWITVGISGGLGAIAAVTAPWIFPVLFGAGFRGSVVLLWLLLPGQIFYDLAFVLGQKLMADGHPGVFSVAYVLGALTTIIGLAVSVATYGTVAAAIVTSLSQIVIFGFVVGMVWWIRRRATSGEKALTGDVQPVRDDQQIRQGSH